MFPYQQPSSKARLPFADHLKPLLGFTLLANIIFSSAILALKSKSLGIFNYLITQSPVLWALDKPLLDVYGVTLTDIQFSTAVLVAAAVSLVLSVLLGCVVAFVHHNHKALPLSGPRRWTLYATLAASCALDWATFFPWTYYNLTSSHFEPDYQYRSVNTGNPKYGYWTAFQSATSDLRSWSCGITAWGGFGDSIAGGPLASQCKMETAGYWILLVLAVVSTAVCALLWLDWNSGKKILRDPPHLTADDESDYL